MEILWLLSLNRRAVDLLTRALDTECKRLQLELKITEEKIKRFENRYGMSSGEFMERYGELKFLERIRNELEELKKVAERFSRGIPRQELRKS